MSTASRRQSLTRDQVKREARALGFGLVGIAAADRFADAELRAVQWAAQGRQAGMGWLSEARLRQSARPEELMPGVQSIIVAAASYRRDESSEGAGSRPRGRVASYARGEDYHVVLRGRLRQLVERLTDLRGAPFRSRIFVDSSPLLEREAAVRAGIGFQGKNSMLLAPGGSYTLLGAILTDLPLEIDSPLRRDCGQCRLCVEACPTGALDDGHTVDAGRCISYLTIELKDSIPVELRPAVGDWIFGCDVCQQVCPWNQGRAPFAWPELSPPTSGAVNPDLAELLALSEEAFSARFRRSPLKRAKRRGLLRNAAVALGNSGDPAAVPALIAALSDAEPLVRGHAAWALGRLGGGPARGGLRAALATEGDPAVRAEMLAALRSWTNPAETNAEFG